MSKKSEFRVGDVIMRIGGVLGISATILDFDGLNYVVRWNWGGTSLMREDYASDYYIRIDDIVGGR